MSGTLSEVLAATIEQQGFAGGSEDILWCPPEAARELSRVLAMRDLYGITLQAVRLLRAMQHADPRGYLGFIYMNPRLHALRSGFFRNSFRHVISMGRLDGIVVLATTGDGIQFLEQQTALKDTTFDIAFGQMPLITAFLHLAYLALTPENFDEICAPVISAQMTCNADDVAAVLRTKLLEWIKPHLETEHHTRQATALHRYCARRNLKGPESIDNDTIFDFWKSHCEISSVEGFRKFRNAAHRVMVYRRAWMDSRIEQNIMEAASIGAAASETGDGGVVDLERSQLEPLEPAEWVSPLTVLATPPCQNAAWITQTDRNFIAHLVADPKLIDGTAVETKEARSLFANEPPIERFFRTLLRFTFFGALQGVMIKGGDKGPYADFLDVSRHLARVEANVRKTVGHGARVLAERNHPTGHRAIIYLFPDVRRTFDDCVGDPASMLKKAFDLQEIILEDGKTIARRLRSMTVDRAGLSKEDIKDQESEDAFSKGLDAVLAVHRHIDKYRSWLARQDLAHLFEEDTRLFIPVLQCLYGGEHSGSQPSGRKST